MDRPPRRHHHPWRALLPGPDRHGKRLIAFSSVSHMGFVMLGIATLTPFGFNAAIFGMVARPHHRDAVLPGRQREGALPHPGDPADVRDAQTGAVPRLDPRLLRDGVLGLPGLAGFWGEFPAILSATARSKAWTSRCSGRTWSSPPSGPSSPRSYLLWLYQRTAFGEPTPEFAHDGHIHDVEAPEWIADAAPTPSSSSASIPTSCSRS